MMHRVFERIILGREIEMRSLAIFALAVTLPSTAYGQHLDNEHAFSYAGQEARAIKSLSQDDFAELRRGGGWGLAKSAELNGVPGPAHLLELKDAIPLDATQVSAIRAIYEMMRTDAIIEGERLIALERSLEDHFRNGTITDDILQRLLAEIADSQQRLRYIHLSTHLKTPSLLTKAQVARYNELRGYATKPCSQVPPGHDADQWRKHNDCD